MNIRIIILAAGKGTRMNSELPKVLVPVHGRPMIEHFLNSIVMSGVTERPVIVVSPENKDQVKSALHHFNAEYVVQEQQLGTGHAVKCAIEQINETVDKILVFNGDHPFIKAGTIKRLAETEADMVILTTKVVDYVGWEQIFYHWGRIVREDEKIQKIVEFKDSSEMERVIPEVNTGMYCFDFNWVKNNINQIGNQNAQGEFYLTDLVNLAFAEGKKIVGLSADSREVIGINSKEELAIAESLI